LNLVFCGTPLFAVPTLDRLVEAGHRVHLVVTQPDRPSGRGLEFLASAIKARALALNVPVIQPEKIKINEAFRTQLAAIAPDAIIVVGYGRIIPQWMIDLPPQGNINLHASLLPKYRGAAPIQWAIAKGESVTGVTTMRIDAGLDTGDILLQQEMQIEPNDTAETLATKLAVIGADLMVDTLHRLEGGTIQAQPQDHIRATLAPILTKEDGRIDFNLTAQEICNRLRGFQPWPGVYTSFRGKNLRIWDATVGPYQLELKPSKIQIENESIMVGAGGGSTLVPVEIQIEGKKRMSVRDFVHGYRPTDGEILGS
jgi:methionyl-tRNA formyltransferase